MFYRTYEEAIHTDSLHIHQHVHFLKHVYFYPAEFRNQLAQLEKSVAHVPALLIRDILKEELQKSKADRKQMSEEFSHHQVELEQRQQEHSHLLRPTLGHPHAEDSLKALCEKEEARHKDYVAAVEKHTKDLQVSNPWTGASSYSAWEHNTASTELL